MQLRSRSYAEERLVASVQRACLGYLYTLNCVLGSDTGYGDVESLQIAREAHLGATHRFERTMQGLLQTEFSELANKALALFEVRERYVSDPNCPANYPDALLAARDMKALVLQFLELVRE